MAHTIEVSYYNTFWLKKAIYLGTPTAGSIPYDYTSGLTAPQEHRGGQGSNFPGLAWNPSGFPTYPSGCGSETQKYQTAPPTPNISTYPFDETENWFIEESRYQGGYNSVSLDFGAKAYLKEDDNSQEVRPNALIYSGIYNSKTGLNQTNVFSVGESITKAVDPQRGSIQKLYAEDTNLIVFQEDKVNRALIDKDQIYTSEGGTQTLPPGTVIGQITPYRGEFGISKNPESFAVYGFRKYFADKDRGSILRLSHDGMTEISEYGMSNFFRDELKNINENPEAIDIPAIYGNSQSGGTAFASPFITITEPVDLQIGSQLIINGIEFNSYVIGYDSNSAPALSYVALSEEISYTIPNDSPIVFRSFNKDKIIGGWDIHDGKYTLSIQKAKGTLTDNVSTYETLSFDEDVLGWPSFFSFKPNNMFSLKNTYFTTNSGEIYQHYFNNTPNNRNVFYEEAPAKSSVTFVFNPQPNVNKNFLTLGYEGSNGWQGESFVSDIQGLQEVPDNYVNPSTTNPSYVNYTDTSVIVNSYYEGAYDSSGNEYPAALTHPIYRAGFNLKEGKYVANLKSNSSARAGEVVFGPDSYGGYPTSGIKGFTATVKLSTDISTNPGGVKQIFAVSSNQVQSSN